MPGSCMRHPITTHQFSSPVGRCGQPSVLQGSSMLLALHMLCGTDGSIIDRCEVSWGYAERTGRWR
jgi:hypothetical protein